MLKLPRCKNLDSTPLDAEALWGQIVRLVEYACPVARFTLSDVEPGLSEYAVEAWERMTYAGVRIRIVPAALAPVSPWGINRFREPTPPGGLRLVSWDDAAR